MIPRLKSLIMNTIQPFLSSKSAKNPSIISIIGTTGVGKSQLSIELAKKLNGEIINADSMQMYKDLPQITNKHPMDERKGVPHHVMNHVDWNEEYFIHRFQEEALVKINEILQKGKIPILVGGTHYYLQSLLFLNKTINKSSLSDQEQQKEIQTTKQRELTKDEIRLLDGPSSKVHQELMKIDPIVAQKFHPNDTRRIRRCLEIYLTTGKKPSEIYTKQQNYEDKNSKLRFNTLFIWCYSKLPVLDARLDSRVDKMFDNGASFELNQLYDFYKLVQAESPSGPDMERGVWQVIGFKEFLPYLTKHGNLDDSKLDQILENQEFADCLNEMKLKTRRYARKQIKWIKNLLIPELSSESEQGWRNGGKVFVLDATDLSKWDENVADRGIAIATNFLNGGGCCCCSSSSSPSFTISELPDSLKSEGLIVEKKEEYSQDKWKHHACDVCLDKEGKPLILVGTQWEIHLKSKKHKHSLVKGKRKREYEEYLANKKKQEEEDK